MVATTIKYFLVLWLVATLVNMWVGVSKAGNFIKDEAPVALLVFAVPAIVPLSFGGDYLLPTLNNCSSASKRTKQD